jgi:hypothetical protein
MWIGLVENTDLDEESMKRLLWLLIMIFTAFAANPVFAETRMIVRDTLGSPVLNSACTRLGCTVEGSD